MKKIKKHIIIAFSLLSFMSCNFLEKEPLDFMSPETYYSNEKQLESNLAGVYKAIGADELYGRWYLYRNGIEGDEAYSGSTYSAVGMHVSYFSPSLRDLYNVWKNLWFGVERANCFLENIDVNPEIDIKVRDRMRGEALFLRAYYYFLLVQYWGDVPLKLTSTKNANDVNNPAVPKKDVYIQILKDMEIAEGLVPDIRSLGYGGRVNKSAVRGILARVCLHMAGYPVYDTSKYADARKWAKMVMDDTDANHRLLADYRQIFINYAQDKYDIGESIWEIEFFGNGSDAFKSSGNNGFVNCGPKLANNELVGEQFGGLRPTYKLYASYEEGDERRDWNIANFTFSSTGQKNYHTSTTTKNIYGRYLAKFRREYELVLPRNKAATPQNVPVLRYSDILLMFAEADNEVNNGPSAEGIEAVNMVRRRGLSSGIKSIKIINGGTGYTSVPKVTFNGPAVIQATGTAVIKSGKVTSITFKPDHEIGITRGSGYTAAPSITFSGGGGTGAEAIAIMYAPSDADVKNDEINDFLSFRQLIQDERLREFPSECLRKSDLVRWNIYLYEMKKISEHLMDTDPTATYKKVFSNIWERYLLWPIPSIELNLNKALTQNPNW